MSPPVRWSDSGLLGRRDLGGRPGAPVASGTPARGDTGSTPSAWTSSSAASCVWKKKHFHLKWRDFYSDIWFPVPYWYWSWVCYGWSRCRPTPLQQGAPVPLHRFSWVTAWAGRSLDHSGVRPGERHQCSLGEPPREPRWRLAHCKQQTNKQTKWQKNHN